MGIFKTVFSTSKRVKYTLAYFFLTILICKVDCVSGIVFQVGRLCTGYKTLGRRGNVITSKVF